MKIPNLTKLVTAEMPKGRGRKGTKAPAKRRPPIPVENRLELNPIASGEPSTPGTGMEVHVSSPSSASLTAPISVNVGGSNAGPFMPPTPWSFASPFPRTFMPPTGQFMSGQFMPGQFAPFGSPHSSPYPPVPTSTSYSGMDPTSGGTYPFRLHFIAGNISVCNGCKGKYKKLGPPHDICLQHEEWRTFTPQGSNTCQSRFANVYYHCSVACVMVVWPSFIPSAIVVPVEVQSRLLPEHKQWLYASFGVYVP